MIYAWSLLGFIYDTLRYFEIARSEEVSLFSLLSLRYILQFYMPPLLFDNRLDD